ncbi:hypothetical protein [Thermococcus sp.]
MWVEKNGKLYTFPPDSFEVKASRNTLAENFKLKFNFKEARVKELKNSNSKIQPMAHDVYYEWRTGDDKTYLH